MRGKLSSLFATPWGAEGGGAGGYHSHSGWRPQHLWVRNVEAPSAFRETRRPRPAACSSYLFQPQTLRPSHSQEAGGGRLTQSPIVNPRWSQDGPSGAALPRTPGPPQCLTHGPTPGTHTSQWTYSASGSSRCPSAHKETHRLRAHGRSRTGALHLALPPSSSPQGPGSCPLDTYPSW